MIFLSCHNDIVSFFIQNSRSLVEVNHDANFFLGSLLSPHIGDQGIIVCGDIRTIICSYFAIILNCVYSQFIYFIYHVIGKLIYIDIYI